MDIKTKYNIIIVGLVILVILFTVNLLILLKNHEEAEDIDNVSDYNDEENTNLEDNDLDNPLNVEKVFFIIKKDFNNNRIYTNDGEFDDLNNAIKEENTLCKVKAIVRDNKIIEIKETINEAIEFRNILIKDGKESNLDLFIKGIEANVLTISPISREIKDNVADIKIKDRKVISITIKPDIISGKVLRTGDDYIEIEGYGKLEIDKDYETYKMYGDLSLEPTKSILVGYDVTDFVVSNGKINAALIKDKIKAENIRVLILTSKFKDIYHKEVEIKSDSGFKLIYDGKEKEYKAQDKLVIKKEDKLIKSGRVKILPLKENGKIEISSINRLEGKPKYRGTLEIAKDSKGLFIINELSLEEYLYAVIPSEMPTSYGIEALKTQAVCARSYAYKQLHENKLKEYGAHVDDSISYQVYNNVFENKDSILAVKDTYGKVIEHKGEIISAYYFSTSCGHTSSIEDVWGGESLSYLKGKLMVDEDSIEAFSNNKIDYKKLKSEDNFKDFITNNELDTYEKDNEWYRWQVTISSDNIKKVVNDRLEKRYNANPGLILTQVKDKKAIKYESQPIKDIGEIKDIQVLERGDGGIITQLLIKGSKKNIKVVTEYNIRSLLAPLYDSVEKNNKSKATGLSLLPSAFFIIEKGQNKDIKSYIIKGGGYGHGVGMSQNGVKPMVEKGMNYEEIIKFFYNGTSIANIYN